MQGNRQNMVKGEPTDWEKLWETVENPGNHVMYYLRDGPEKAFVSEELMLIPEDTELPPDYVQEW